jgi:GNAT superfamily N-acetyltransferase
MMEFRIRPATVEDAAEILRQRIRMLEDMGMGTTGNRDAIREPTLRYLSQALRTGTYHGWLAEDEAGHPVSGGGVLLVDWPPSAFDQKTQRPYIINMYTDPAYRRRGLANRILQQALAFLHSEGFAIARLNASADGKPLYEKSGFLPSNEMTLLLDPSP